MSSEGNIVPQKCPICSIATNYLYRIQHSEDETSEWYRCQCGVIFQAEEPDLSTFSSKDFFEQYNDERVTSRVVHLAKTYAPIIEESTYGRKMLDVGFATHTNMEYMEDRGWVTWGIDNSKQICGHDNIYSGDYEDYAFTYNADMRKIHDEIGEVELKRKFDLIWMGNVFSSFKKPLETLKKTYNLLEENGVLFLTVPDIDFINKCGVGAYQHFKPKENYVLWSAPAIKRELEKMGFEVIVCKRNFSASYVNYYDVHIVCQKRYF